MGGGDRLLGLPPAERPRIYFFMLGLAETAALGAFLAQDLLLFVLFFDLMLVPFFFLIGIFGGENGVARDDEDDRLHAGRLAADAGGGDRHRDPRLRTSRAPHLLDGRPARPHALGTEASTGSSVLRRRVPGEDAGVPVHGWMPDAYRAAPLPVLALLSGVLSKVGAYGFLRVVLPLYPQATVHFQELILLIARRRDPLRLGDGVHADERAADRRLLLGRPARLHHRSGSSPCGPTAPTARCSRWSTTASWSAPSS